jgi:hypothetical protein
LTLAASGIEKDTLPRDAPRGKPNGNAWRGTADKGNCRQRPVSLRSPGRTTGTGELEMIDRGKNRGVFE